MRQIAPPSVDQLELVTFGVNESGKLLASGGLRARALKPIRNEAKARLELSTFCMDRLDPADIWSFLEANLNAPQHARADFSCRSILGVPLLLDPNWEPEHHVDIHGWPDQPERRKDLQQTLADLGRVTIAPSIGTLERR
jgi:hypothetical protein